MSTVTEKTVSPQEIELVRELIYGCHQFCLNRKKTAETIQEYAQIDPRITIGVWKAMKKANRGYFFQYKSRVNAKKQFLAHRISVVLHMHKSRGMQRKGVGKITSKGVFEWGECREALD